MPHWQRDTQTTRAATEARSPYCKLLGPDRRDTVLAQIEQQQTAVRAQRVRKLNHASVLEASALVSNNIVESNDVAALPCVCECGCVCCVCVLCDVGVCVLCVV
jgi:hypothetical protein